jgi:opacity protein-like surface antigen
LRALERTSGRPEWRRRSICDSIPGTTAKRNAGTPAAPHGWDQVLAAAAPTTDPREMVTDHSKMLRKSHGIRRCGSTWQYLALVLTAAALGSTMAGAAEPASSEPLRFEVSPFIGYRLGGGFSLNDTGQHVDIDDHGSFALALDARAGDAGQYELLYARESTVLRGDAFASTKVDVEYLHIGGTALLGDAPRLKPYILGGIGVTRLSPGPTAGHENTRFSASLGLGMRVPISTHFSVRLEGRGFLTLVNADSAIFCRSDQAGALCLVQARGSSLFQFDFLAAAAYAF